MIFNTKPYVSLEDIDTRRFAIEDPRGFLAQFPNGAVLDEVQHCPDLFSYLQTLVDSTKQNGLFVLTGSQQFGLTAKISQSLAGRVGFIQLLPFTYGELNVGNLIPESLEKMLFTGFYPPIFDRNIPPQSWYSDYVITYLERDIRQLINVQNLATFHRFLQMCAARTGQLLNLSSLASDCGITHNTAKAWISVLETSYILFLLQPHFRNYNKRLVKSPKLYFYDTGLACLLAGIQNAEQLITHPMRGPLFETWVAAELIKHRFNKGLLSNVYFWRDSQGHEIDFIIEEGEKLIPIEVKAGQTVARDYFNGIQYWQSLTNQRIPGYLIYAGQNSQKFASTQTFSWQDINKLIDQF
jgi:predicted AAA+ superfamily ATPase